ncbi:DNA internalization-related competence protein ComEC/Rec2 [Desulfonauticus submarinus]
MNKVSLFLWQKCLLFFVLGILTYRFPFYGSILFLALFFIFFQQNKTKLFFYFFLSYLIGIFYLYYRLPSFCIEKDLSFFKNKIYVEGCIEDILFLPNSYSRIILDNLKFNKNPVGHNLVINLNHQLKQLDIGDKIRGVFKVKPITGLKNKGYFGYSFYWLKKNIFFKTYQYNKKNFVIEKTRSNSWKYFAFKGWKKVKNRILKIFSTLKQYSNEAKALSLIFLLNDKSYLNFNLIEIFRKGGLSHSLALSGLHLSVILLLGFVLSWIIFYIFPNTGLFIPRIKLGIIFSILFSIFYLFLARYPISLVRAEIMFFCWGLLFLFNKKNFFLDGYFLALFFILIYSPQSLFDISFQFSFLAVIGIYLFYTFYISKLNIKFKLARYIFYIFISTVAANLFILPLQVYYFNQIYLSLWVNVIWIPWLSFIIIPSGFLGLIFSFFPYISKIFFHIMLLNLDKFLIFLHYLNKNDLLKIVLSFRPNGYLIILYYIMLSLLFIKKQRYKIYVLLISFSIFVVIIFKLENKFYSKLSIYDVGQAQSILYEVKGKRILIDGGGSFNQNYNFGRKILSKILTYQKRPFLNFVFLTHPDIDHLRGLYYILTNFKYKKFYFNGSLPASSYDKKVFKMILNKVEYQVLHKDNLIKISDDDYIKILHPPVDYHFKSKNNNSLVLQVVENGKNNYLICGDIEKDGLKYLVSRVENLKSKVLIIPHHGSKTAFYPLFYQKVNPEIVVVSCGFLNHFNFPDKTILTYFQSKNIPLYTTANLGQIDIINLNNKKIKVVFDSKIKQQLTYFCINN